LITQRNQGLQLLKFRTESERRSAVLATCVAGLHIIQFCTYTSEVARQVRQYGYRCEGWDEA
jgi:hypothetical protein